MWRLSVTIAFRERSRAGDGAPRRGAKHYQPKAVPSGATTSARKIKLWYAGCRIVPIDLLQRVTGRDDGNLMLAILEEMADADVIAFDDDPAEVLPDIERVEMRIWA